MDLFTNRRIVLWGKPCISSLKLIILLKQSVMKPEENEKSPRFSAQVDDSEKNSTNTSSSEAGGHVNPVR